MRKLLLTAAAAVFLPIAAQAQTTDPTGATDTTGTTDTTQTTETTTAAAEATAPDGTPAFGFEPYVGAFGAYHDFDTGSKGPLQAGNSANGWLVGGYVGANIPLGGFVVGAEGSIAKGFNDIDFEYGTTGHVGARIGDSGMIFVRAGYHWVEAKSGFEDDDDIIYGLGVEVGPKDIGLGGLTSNAGIRLRLAFDTYDMQSIRPTAGLTFHF